MRYPPEQKEKTRTDLLRIAGRAFRLKGFDGIGVDGLVAEAGLTSGALYKHFGTKRDIFQHVVRVGLERLCAGIARFQATDQREWLSHLARWYLGSNHRADIAGGCALPSLTPEVVRADKKTRRLYQQGLLDALETLASHTPLSDVDDGRERAWAILALLAGGVSLSRAVVDPALSGEIAEAVQKSVEAIGQRRTS